ncbi:unnamed protein product [Lymnaea stagnalis]|uniref:Phosphatidylethanolamine-binding protein n=1 Tax=Lymnaea stagnalis TaxID=6523 RepID=A0AAV2IHQ7_LYMST
MCAPCCQQAVVSARPQRDTRPTNNRGGFVCEHCLRPVTDYRICSSRVISQATMVKILRECLTTLILVSLAASQGADPRLAEVLLCTTVAPADQCNLQVTYPTVGTVRCDANFSNADVDAMLQAPKLKVPLGPVYGRVVVVMFDLDAPVSEQPKDGFVHWVAEATVDSTGNVQTTSQLKDYYQPKPPVGKGSHRYQFYVYDFPPGATLQVTDGRAFQLCQFVRTNGLNQPIASFQFRYARTV